MNFSGFDDEGFSMFKLIHHVDEKRPSSTWIYVAITQKEACVISRLPTRVHSILKRGNDCTGRKMHGIDNAQTLSPSLGISDFSVMLN